ncbi:MAG: di-trans,poly-cis-decaprenylcistransferase [Myxococcales bacterium]|nr:di-trans,poly-cis-decaprenylcistransferase [Myxococcales bacterium]
MVKQPFYAAYTQRLQQQAKTWTLPRHIGIILDGNRRFARTHGLNSVIDGHARGADKLKEVLGWCMEMDIPIITIWIFSLDNFQRDDEEVQGLFKLIERKTMQLLEEPDIHKNRMRINYIGRLNLLPDSLQKTIKHAEETTAHYNRFMLNIAIAYGGREEITDAFCRYMQDGKEHRSLQEALHDLSPETLTPYLYTAGMPDPDLIIRTSGEIRLSGFLLWQSAYAEYYFCDTYWPDFRKLDLLRAVRSYDLRQRRFGR